MFLRKSGSVSFKPQCLVSPTKYEAQFAVNGATDTINDNTHCPDKIEINNIPP